MCAPVSPSISSVVECLRSQSGDILVVRGFPDAYVVDESVASLAEARGYSAIVCLGSVKQGMASRVPVVFEGESAVPALGRNDGWDDTVEISGSRFSTGTLARVEGGYVGLVPKREEKRIVFSAGVIRLKSAIMAMDYRRGLLREN
ncbi:hypothetical protein GCM10007108_04360 [Thermogymnomonas acidicola]|uniref:Uncharacterized protein n=1 Tax=Thermogymnomonas acidicola TaxID=399579 RepID=A0AA37BQ83_9ARCH|nr:hypothetical protein GCM10007108_04360 [Thermogymnomonas acidicola]